MMTTAVRAPEGEGGCRCGHRAEQTMAASRVYGTVRQIVALNSNSIAQTPEGEHFLYTDFRRERERPSSSQAFKAH